MRRGLKATAAGMPIAHLLSRRHAEIAISYLAGYVLLDWLSYVHPFASFGITPWNPPTGLSFALILLFGAEFMPWLFVAPVLADALVRGFALPLGAEIAAAAIIGGGYAIATGVLLLPRLAFDPTLASRRSLVLLATVAVARLSLARSIVEAHGGRLSIESGASGATVSFTLPAQSGERAGEREGA